MKKLLIGTGAFFICSLCTIALLLFSPIGNNKKMQSFILSQEKILSVFYEEETIYSEGFSAEKWAEIEPGLSSEDVASLVGEPLLEKSFQDSELYWYFSKQGPQNTNYRVRIVVFDSNRNVLKTIKKFYLD